MSENKLKTAVLGLEEGGQLLLKAAAKTNYFQLLAVADKDSTLAKNTATEYDCTAYDDYRQLVIQNQLDCLLVAAGIYSCDEQIKTAMKRKFNILKLAPPARDFEEAVEFVRLAEDENIKFAIANPARFAKSHLALSRFLQQDQTEQISMITAFCSIGVESTGSWQNDPKLAGGGVLLRNCYQIIDQIVCSFGVPEQVFSLNTSTAGDKQQRHYLTEDIALLTMKFSDTSFGSLIAGRAFGPKQQFLKIYGKEKILTVTETQFTVSDTLGEVIEDFQYDDDRLCGYTALLENFALSILQPDKNKLCSSARENLKAMAVIESAYLSARTGMPELPRKIPQMAQAEPVNIRQDHKQ